MSNTVLYTKRRPCIKGKIIKMSEDDLMELGEWEESYYDTLPEWEVKRDRFYREMEKKGECIDPLSSSYNAKDSFLSSPYMDNYRVEE